MTLKQKNATKNIAMAKAVISATISSFFSKPTLIYMSFK